jgi:hypothetical protein
VKILLINILIFLLLWGWLGAGGQAQDRVQFPPVPDKPKAVVPEQVQPSPVQLPPVPDSPSYAMQERLQPPTQVVLPNFEIPAQWIGTNQFTGGVNTFVPPQMLQANQAVELINFLPYGGKWLKKREGYQKIQITPLGTVWAMGIADSANTKSRLFVVGDDDLYVSDNLYNGTYKDIGGTTAEATFLTSTPFGLVISNGTDSTRLYNGDSTVTLSTVALGTCISSTVDWDSTYTVSGNGDTTLVLVADSSQAWTADEWIGFFFRTTANREIIDNGSNWLIARALAEADSNWDDTAYTIIAQPDSVASGLTYPKGQATAYYQDRLFVSSAYYPWRLYYSRERKINEIDIDAFINLDMDAQDQIERMVQFNGYLFPFGSNSIYAINSSLVATVITKSLGCSAPKSIAVGDDYIYFLAQPTGVYRFNGNIYGSLSYKMELISDPIADILSSVRASVLDNACGVYINKQYWLSYSPDTCLVFDERTNAWYKQGFGFTEALQLVSDFRIASSEVLYPSSDVSTDWTSTGANTWSVIDDQTNDADYISGNSKTARVGFTNLSNYATGATIQNITIGCRGKVSYFVNSHIDIGLRANYTTYSMVEFPLNMSWATRTAIIEENPATGQAWTSGDLDSMVLNVFGWVDFGHTDYVSGLWVIPVYRNDIPTRDFLFASTSKELIYQYGGTFADDTASAGSYNVSGIVPTAYYKTGWFNLGSPINQYQMREFWLDKTNDGNVTVYLYKNYSTTAICTLTVTEQQDTTHLSWLPPKVSGHAFQIEMETSADSCQIRGWGALLRNLGERKD